MNETRIRSVSKEYMYTQTNFKHNRFDVNIIRYLFILPK